MTEAVLWGESISHLRKFGISADDTRISTKKVLSVVFLIVSPEYSVDSRTTPDSSRIFGCIRFE
jgi:hypothetical protein